MTFEVDIEKLISNDIDINLYLFIQFVKNQNYPLLEKYVKFNSKFFSEGSINYLLSIDLIKFRSGEEYTLQNLEVTAKYNKIFEPKISKNNSKVEDWIEEWYSLWPKGVKSGYYPVRSGLKGCLTKMKKFVKDNPDLSPDVIISATKEYLDRSRSNNYNYIQLAHNFISKNNISTLAASCEAMKEDKNMGGVEYLNDI